MNVERPSIAYLYQRETMLSNIPSVVDSDFSFVHHFFYSHKPRIYTEELLDTQQKMYPRYFHIDQYTIWPMRKHLIVHLRISLMGTVTRVFHPWKCPRNPNSTLEPNALVIKERYDDIKGRVGNRIAQEKESPSASLPTGCAICFTEEIRLELTRIVLNYSFITCQSTGWRPWIQSDILEIAI